MLFDKKLVADYTSTIIKLYTKCMQTIVPKSEHAKIHKLRANRYKLREIGAMYGVTRERIRQILLTKPIK